MKKIIIGNQPQISPQYLQGYMSEERQQELDEMMKKAHGIDNMEFYQKEDFDFEDETARTARRRRLRNENPIKSKYRGKKNPFKK